MLPAALQVEGTAYMPSYRLVEAANCPHSVLGHFRYEHHASTDQPGKITFPTSCDPKVQPRFERDVAMLHSFWFTEAGKTFNAVVEQDPKCAIAYRGLARNLLGNSLAGPPSLRDAQAASEAG